MIFNGNGNGQRPKGNGAGDFFKALADALGNGANRPGTRPAGNRGTARPAFGGGAKRPCRCSGKRK